MANDNHKSLDLDSNQFLIYKTEDGKIRIDVTVRGATVWLTLTQMGELFQRDKSVMAKHIKNIIEDGELDSHRTMAKYAIVQIESAIKQIKYFDVKLRKKSKNK